MRARRIDAAILAAESCGEWLPENRGLAVPAHAARVARGGQLLLLQAAAHRARD